MFSVQRTICAFGVTDNNLGQTIKKLAESGAIGVLLHPYINLPIIRAVGVTDGGISQVINEPEVRGVTLHPDVTPFSAGHVTTVSIEVSHHHHVLWGITNMGHSRCGRTATKKTTG